MTDIPLSRLAADVDIAVQPATSGAEIPLSRLGSEIALRNQALSEEMAKEIILLFKISVKATLVMTGLLVLLDSIFLFAGVIDASERLVTERIILAIIGASLIQVGAATMAIIYTLFNKPAREASNEQDKPDLLTQTAGS